jgi:hypothetical protein
MKESRIVLSKFDISHLPDLFDQCLVIFAFERVSKLPISQIVFNRALWLSRRGSLMRTYAVSGGGVAFVQGKFTVVIGLDFVFLIVDIHKVF